MVGSLQLLISVRTGEEILKSNYSSVSYSEKQPWFKASDGPILPFGSIISILCKSYLEEWETSAKRSPSSVKLHYLLFLHTSSYLLPANKAFLQRSKWKIAPSENISHMGSICQNSVSLRIYGATQPGVPHLKKRYSFTSAKVASPKSTITGSSESPLSMMFQGFKSLCMILLPCICLTPLSNPAIIPLTSCLLNLPFLSSIAWQSVLPASSSMTTQIELSDSQTPSIFNILLLGYVFNYLRMVNQFIKLYLPFLLLQQFCFMKAFTANLQWSVRRSASQTVAKLPLPSLRVGLNIS